MGNSQTNQTVNKLKGKVIHFLGDSITWGACANCVDKRYVNRIAAMTGAICNNYGISGTRIALQQQPSNDPSFDQDFCSRVEKMDPNADIVVVFGGTNDFGHGDAPFGTDKDETADTFCGALHVLYQRLKNRYPDAWIVVLTPLHRVGEDNIYGDGSKKVPTRPLKDYVEQIRKTATHYGFPVLDLYQVTELDPNKETIHRDLMPDGLHPNAEGHAILAEKIADYLQKNAK